MHDALVLNKENENRRKQIFGQVSQSPSPRRLSHFNNTVSDLVLLRSSQPTLHFYQKTRPLQYLPLSLLSTTVTKTNMLICPCNHRWNVREGDTFQQ
jgi:hypothetical protein